MQPRQRFPGVIKGSRRINWLIVVVSITIGVMLFSQSAWGTQRSSTFDISPIDTPTQTATSTPPVSPIDTPTPTLSGSANSIYLPGIIKLIDFRCFLPILLVSR